MRSISLAVKDILYSFTKFRIWLMFGWLDVKFRYRRSLLGPLWITIAAGMMVLSMGILYSQIFMQSVSEYLPFLACGFIIWIFISGLVNDGCNTFVIAERQIKQINLPLPTYALRLVWRSVLIFIHNVLIILLVIVIFKKYSLQLLIFPFAFALICVMFVSYCIIMGFVCARYRDVPQIVISITQIFMFITPVFWKKEFLTKYHWVTDLNPFFHVLEILRRPLLGEPFPVTSLYVVIFITLFLMILAVVFMSKYRDRLAYWV